MTWLMHNRVRTNIELGLFKAENNNFSKYGTQILVLIYTLMFRPKMNKIKTQKFMHCNFVRCFVWV